MSKQKRAKPPDSKTGKVTGRESPGDITALALAAREGDLEALRILTTRVTKELHRVAQEHLYPQGELRLSATQLSRMVIHQFALANHVDLQSRQDFFDFAEKEIQRLVEQIHQQGHLLAPGQEAYAGLQALFRGKTRKKNPVAFGLALVELQRTDPDLARVLHLHYFLGLERREVATWLGRVESDFAELWDEAQAVLRGHYQQISKTGIPGDSLDSSTSARYAGGAPLVPLLLSGKAPSSAPSDSEQRLQAEIARLQNELAAASARIQQLEAQLAGPEQPDLMAARTQLQELLTPPALDEVPLLEGSSLEVLWQQFQANYGRWLRHFGAAQDSIFLDQIRQHDPQGVQKLSEKISRQRSRERRESGAARTPTLSEIVAKGAVRGDLALNGRTFAELLDPANRDLAILACARLMKRHYRS